MSKEAKVGLLVAILSLILLGLSPGQQRRAPFLGDRYRLVFHNVEGIRVGDEVVFGGVPCGKVVEIDFAPQESWPQYDKTGNGLPVVLAQVAITGGVRIPVNSGYRVVANLNGQRFINILPGDHATNAGKGTIMTNELPPALEDQLSSTLKAFKDLSVQTEAVRKQIADPNFRREVKDMASNMRFYSREFLASSGQAPEYVHQLEHTIAEQEANLEGRLHQIDEKVERVRSKVKEMTPALRRNLVAYETRLKQGEQELHRTLDQAQGYVDEFQRYTDLYLTRYSGKLNPEEVSRRMYEISRRLDDIAALAGDMHAISSDKQVQADFKAIFTRLRERSEKLKATVESYEKKLDAFPIKP